MLNGENKILTKISSDFQRYLLMLLGSGSERKREIFTHFRLNSPVPWPLHLRIY